MYLGSAAGRSAAPAWTADGALAAARFGASVASAGDVNGDGYDDVIVGAPGEDPQVAGGVARLYLGSAAGLSAAAAWTAEGGADCADFGTSVASAGDVNGDGLGDVIVGGDPGTLFLGTPAGLSPSPAWVEDLFGSTVGVAGRVGPAGPPIRDLCRIRG